MSEGKKKIEEGKDLKEKRRKKGFEKDLGIGFDENEMKKKEVLLLMQIL